MVVIHVGSLKVRLADSLAVVSWLPRRVVLGVGVCYRWIVVLIVGNNDTTRFGVEWDELGVKAVIEALPGGS